MGTFISSVFFFGFMLGAVLLGSVSDRIGRRPALLLAMALASASAITCALAPGPLIFGAGRLVGGVSAGGLSLVSFVWNAEFLGRHRKILVASSMTAYAIGVCVLACLAWVLPMWRHQCFAIFALGLPVFGVCFWLPESPKWLEAQGRSQDTYRVIADIARYNGFPMSPLVDEVKPEDKESGAAPEAAPLTDLLLAPLHLRIVVMCFSWFAASLAYFGLALNAGGLGGNIYVTSIIGALSEVPAYVIIVLCVDMPSVGRKTLAIGFFLIGGSACVYAHTLPLGASALIVAASVGRLAISGAFAIIYFWGVELFPTNIRASALGIQSFSARIAGIAAPIVINESSSPMLFLGLPAIAAAVICLWMPETAGRPMPDTLRDVQNEEQLSLLPTKMKNHQKNDAKEDAIY
jgi:hypothetical protein